MPVYLIITLIRQAVKRKMLISGKNYSYCHMIRIDRIIWLRNLYSFDGFLYPASEIRSAP